MKPGNRPKGTVPNPEDRRRSGVLEMSLCSGLFA